MNELLQTSAHSNVQTDVRLGVNFRNFTQREATKLSITGWCMNTDNEKVCHRVGTEMWLDMLN